MFTTLQGRVASNPMLVPAPASMATGRSTEFAEVLEQVVADQAPSDEAPAEAPARDEIAPPTAETPQSSASDTPQQPDPEESSQLEWHTHPAANSATGPALAAEAGAETLSGRVGTGPEATNNRAQAPWSHGQAEPTGLAEGPIGHGTGFAPATTQATPVAVAGKTSGEGMVRGLEGAWSKQGSPTRAAAVAAGYRTHNAAAAQRMEMARESVFQQILLKLHDGGGEMRLRLDPPEFGELDLRLVLHEGNKLSLSIAAERQEMAQLLQKHLDQLRQTLESAGLQVTDAQVGARSQQHGDRESSPPLWQDADKQSGAPQPSTARSGGYLHADGLDFWV